MRFKIDMSIEENRFARLERLSFDTYNEADALISTIEKYHDWIERYLELALVD